MRNKLSFVLVLALVLVVAVGGAFAATTELLTNGSFQNGATNWDSWAGTRTIEGTVTDSTGFAPSAHCAKVTGGYRHIEANNPCAHVISTTTVYHVKAWFYIPSLDDGSGATSARMWMRYQDTTGGPILVDDTLTPVPSDPAKNTEIPIGVWTKKEFDVHVSTDGNMAYVAFGVYGHVGDARSPIAPTVYFDELSITADYNAISGLVTDDSGVPVAGAAVTVKSANGMVTLWTGTTQSDGTYTTSITVPAGTYTVNASKANYDNFNSGQTFTVGSGNWTATTVSLVKYTTAPVVGQIYQMVNGVKQGVAGCVVVATAQDGVGFVVNSLPSDATGHYSMTLAQYVRWQLSVQPPAGLIIGTQPEEVFTDNNDTVTRDIQMIVDPNYDPDLIFCALTDSFPATTDASTGDWALAYPSNTLLTQMASPTVQMVGSVKWENNLNADGDGYKYAGTGTDGSWDPANPIPVQGASIVVAVRPERTGNPNNWQSVVDIFRDELVLGVSNGNGLVCVRRKGSQDYAPVATAIPSGQKTVLSLVVQPDGTYKVWANGTEIMNNTETVSPAWQGSKSYAMTSLVPGSWNNTDFMRFINIGRNNNDGWSTFNGLIGDVRAFKVALTDAKRQALEASLMSKIVLLPPVTIHASVDAAGGGTISPAGDLSVPAESNKTFTIKPALGYTIADVKVDNVSIPEAVTSGSYTFVNLLADHTIVASFSALPKQIVSGNVKGAGVNLPGASVYFSTLPNASLSPMYTATTDASGNYSQSLAPGTWYVCAAANGYFIADDLTVTVANVAVPNVNFNLAANTTNIPAVDRLVFAALVDTLPATQDAAVDTWSPFYPRNASFTKMATPTVDIIDGLPWVKNQRGTGGDDGFLVGTYSAPIATNGVTIVAAVKPTYITIAGEARGEIVDCFYGQLFLAVNHGTGEVIVCRKPYTQTNTGYIIPNGQKTILSLVVQSDGAFVLYANGTQVATGATTAVDDYKQLVPSGQNAINIGRNNPDGWSSFNGNIGDVFLYKAALTDAERQQLEASLFTKFGVVSMVSIKGTVTVAGTTPALPIVGATVSVAGTSYTATTGQDGSYTLWVAPSAQYSVTASATGYTANSIQVTVGTTNVTGQNIQLAAPQTLSGIVTNGTSPIANAVVQLNPVGLLNGPAVVTGADGKYFFSPQTGSYEIYADALGYAGKTQSLTVPENSGQMNVNITLVAKAETGVITNGGFESVTAGKPTGWHDWAGSFMAAVGGGYVAGLGDDYISSTNVPGEFVSGSYGAKYSPVGTAYTFLSQAFPVTPGSTYNVYWKMKGDAGIDSLFQFINFRTATGAEIDPATYIDYGTTAPTTWTQFPLTGPALRVPIPAGAVNMVLLFGKTDRDWAGKSIYVDDVVVDRIESITNPVDVANVASLKSKAAGTLVRLTGNVTVICAPRVTSAGARSTTFFYVGETQGLGGLRVVDKVSDNLNVGNTVTGLTGTVRKTASGEVYLELTSDPTGSTGTAIRPLGLNNKTAATDAKALTNAVKVWGKVAYTAGANTFTIDDGYGTPITVNVNGVTLPSSFNGKTAVVTGVVTKFSGSLAVEAGEVSAF